jgi:hypothetical protein
MILTILALVFSMLLAFPALAEAQCAWLVWNYDPHSSQICEVRTAAPAQDLCYKVVEVMKEELKARKVKTSGVFVCLPDTIDPRGPKGGGR